VTRDEAPRARGGDAALAAGLLLLAVVLLAPEAIPWPRVRALATLFAFFYPLGELGLRALFPRFGLDPLRRALVAVSVGNALLCLVVGGAWLAGNRLSTAGRALPVLVVALAAAAWARRGARPDAGGRGRFPIGSALVLLALVAPLLRFQDPLLAVDDSLDHVGSLRKRIETDSVFPRSTFYAESRENGPDARKGLYHGVLALAAASTRTPVLSLWDALAFAGAAWVLLSVLGTGRTLFTGAARPLLAALCFAMTWDGGFAGDALARLNHPSRMSLAPYWTIWALLLDAANPPPLGLVALLGFGLAATHATAPVLFSISASFLVLFLLVLGRGEARAAIRPTVAAWAALAAGAAPYLALRAAVSTPLLDPIHTEPQGLLYWTRDLFTVNPFWAARSWGTLGLLAIPAAIVLVRRARRDVPLAFLASGVLGAVAVLANPLATAPLQKVLGYLVVRIGWLAPHVFVLADAIAGAAARVRAAWAPRGIRAAAPLAVPLALLVAVGLLAAGSARAYARWSAPPPNPLGLRPQREAFEAVDRAIASPAVILADPATGYAVPALTRHWTVSAMAQHTPPNDPDARERLRDTRRVLSPYVNAADTVTILRRYRAEWILLNAAAPARVSRTVFHAAPGTFEAAREKIEAREDLFTPILAVGDLRLYRLTEAALAGPLPAADAPPARPVPVAPAAPAALAEWEDGAYVLHEAAVLSADVAPGGRLAVASVWERRRDLPERNRYLIVRLDRRDDRGRLGGAPLAPLGRRIADRLRGGRTRARLGFAPGDGFLPPDEWPLGRPVRDESELPIPADLAPGEYDVKIRIIDEAFFPNLHRADLFSHEGSYDGVPIGTVRVTDADQETRTS
jgi:hypothetical protein